MKNNSVIFWIILIFLGLPFLPLLLPILIISSIGKSSKPKIKHKTYESYNYEEEEQEEDDYYYEDID